jgi:hypothetical protein
VPGLPQLAAAALGGLLLAIGSVLLLNGLFVGGALVLGGAALIWWSILRPQ